MYELRLEGMDTIDVSERIELPFTFMEMLRSPWGIRIDAEDLYKNGGEINRFLLDKTPLKHDKKYVVCYVNVVYLTPQLLSVPTIDWHCDGSNVPFLADDRLHTMVCVGEHISAELKTEFLKKGVTLQVPDEVSRMTHVDFRRWITTNADQYGIDEMSVKVDEGVINTWTSRHLHRVLFAERPHFRFFWKVSESDLLTPQSRDKAYRPSSNVIVGDYGAESLNIEQGPRGIIMRGINYKY